MAAVLAAAVWGWSLAPAPVLAQSTVDYDSDDDGLIEVASLAQLDAIRWDLDGDGATSSGSDTTNYTAAFPRAETGMGCEEDEADADDQVCTGYELTADLDFDSDGDGDVDASDNSGTYWNAGKGWTPIGGSFTGVFDGGGHTISSLFGGGLFTAVGAGGAVRNVGLVDVDVTGAASAISGGLAGSVSGAVSFSYVSGGAVAGTGAGSAGGLAGLLSDGSVTASWSSAAVSSEGTGRVGGLVGLLGGAGTSSSIVDSYATGSVTAGGTGAAAGLAGSISSGTVEIENSYATGAVTGTNSRGLIGAAHAAALTVTASYWDTTTSGESISGGGTGKTTSELQTPTSNTGVYADWATTRWDFGTADLYPRLKADWDGDGTATAAEFGPQPVDYDTDGDGLIEIDSLAQLNAVRYDLDGNGAGSSGNEAAHASAFPNAISGMGCPTSGTPTGCIGYELTADLDFDSDGDGDTDAADHAGAYWNAGKGWAPIGSFTAEFDGGGHSISGLFIDAPTAGAGLFSAVDTGGEVRNLGLVGVDVTGAANYVVGALAGSVKGDVSFVYVSGGSVAASGTGKAGGLVGNLHNGTVAASWTSVAVASSSDTGAGGLAGTVSAIGADTASVAGSYAAGPVTHTGTGTAAGLIGAVTNGTVDVDNSYAAGAVTGTNSAGLIGGNSATLTVTASYWDTALTGQSTSVGGGLGKTTSELQTPPRTRASTPTGRPRAGTSWTPAISRCSKPTGTTPAAPRGASSATRTRRRRSPLTPRSRTWC